MRIPQPPPELPVDAFVSTVNRVVQAPEIFQRADYLHWDELRHREPPAGLSRTEWWVGLRMLRTTMARKLPFLGVQGGGFSFQLPDEMLSALHAIDGRAGGRTVGSGLDDGSRKASQYIVSSLMEEAVTSAQLEGAATTRRVAKDMLRGERAPQDASETMIANNYAAIQWIQAARHERMTPERVLELHRVITEGTLSSEQSGVLRAGDDIAVRGPFGEVLHQPPPASELSERLVALCAFANGEADEGFVHPVIRAITVHFMLSYDHPFEDGNGRTARALFYWMMLRQGYWLMEYLSISRLLKKAPAQYARAFLYVETDQNDLTYFLLHQVRTLLQAIDELDLYLEKKSQEMARVQRLIRGDSGLNHRQKALIAHVLRHSDPQYTIASHQKSHGVVYQTARTDLSGLVEMGFLEQRKVGNAFVYWPVADLSSRLKEPHNY